MPLGRLADNPDQQARLLQNSSVPDVNQVVYHTVIRWPGRELAIIEVVKVGDEGGLSAVGLTDLGNTVYAVRVNAAGETEILKKNLPLSDNWLVEGLVTELLIPWHGPQSNADLRIYNDGTAGLLLEGDSRRTLYRYDAQEQWTQVFHLQGSRLISETALTWDSSAVPLSLRTTNKRHYYSTVRERSSTE